MTKYETHKQLVRDGTARDFITLESGFKAYDTKAGYLTADDLRIIADYLDELNRDGFENLVKNVN